jgi:hypothetical protein
MTKNEIFKYFKIREEDYDNHLYFALNEIVEAELMPFLICLILNNNEGIKNKYELMIKQYNEGILDRKDMGY